MAVCVLFYVHFKLWELSCLVFGSVALYAFLTVKLTLWRKRFRAAMNQSDNRWHDRLTESLVNYETVKSLRRAGGCSDEARRRRDVESPRRR